MNISNITNIYIMFITLKNVSKRFQIIINSGPQKTQRTHMSYPYVYKTYDCITHSGGSKNIQWERGKK